MHQILNLKNRTYTGDDTLCTDLPAVAAIVDYSNLGVEIVNTSTLSEDVLNNIANCEHGRLDTCYHTVKSQLISPRVTWNNMAKVSELLVLKFRGVEHTIFVKSIYELVYSDDLTARLGYNFYVYFDNIRLLMCRPSYGVAKTICIEYAFSIGDCVIVRLSLYHSDLDSLYSFSSPCVMFSLVFKDNNLLGCYVTWVASTSSCQVLSPIPSDLEARLLLCLKDKY